MADKQIHFPRTALLLALLLSAGWSIAADSPWTYPGETWDRDSTALASSLKDEVECFLETLETTGFMVVIRGRVACEYGDLAEVSYIASVRKSVLSMLYGPGVAAGSIRLEATLKELGLDDLGGLLPLEEQARVLDLISARSGVYHPASNSGDLLEWAPERGSQPPGNYWLYNNWDFNAAGTIYEQMTGKGIYDALRDDLALPLSMQDFDRARQVKDPLPEVSHHSAYTMWFSTRDMARLGHLMLSEGRWNDQQIIPAGWIRRSTSVVTPIDELNPDFMKSGPCGYGLMWWVWDGEFATGPYCGAYMAAGAHGQWITVLPALDMVVAHKTCWSSTDGPMFNVGRQDFHRLLDLVTGARPATQAELKTWRQQAVKSESEGTLQ